MQTKSALVLAIGLCLCSPVASSPPPPPPQFIDDIARQLIPTPTAESLDRYAALLANDLKVTVNEVEVAASKPAWLAIQRERLGKIDRFVYGYAEGRDNILIMDRFDDRSDEACLAGHSCLFDPRWHARAVRYEIGPDRLVHAIRILETDGIFEVPGQR